MSLLIISHSYPPSNAPSAQRTFFFAKYLMRDCGLNVEVVTPKSAITAAGESDWADKHGVSIPVHRTGYFPFAKFILTSTAGSAVQATGSKQSWHFGKALRSIANNRLLPDRGILWYPFAVKTTAKVIRRNPKLKYILTSAPSFSDHCISLAIRRKFNLKWVADFRDFYWVNAREKTTQGALSKRHQQIEESIVRHADACVFVTNQMRELYIQKYAFLAEKSYTIPNGFDDEEFSLKTTGVQNAKFRIFYSGNFYGGERCPRPLLAALDLLLNRGHIEIEDIEIVIVGNVDNQTKSVVNEFRCKQAVDFRGQLPRSAVLREMSQADLLWLIIADLASHCNSFPVKGFEYFGAKRPIIAFCPPNCAAYEILNENGVNPIFSKDTAIESVCSMIQQQIEDKKMGLGQPFSYANSLRFTRRFQAQQLNQILLSLDSAS